MDHAEALAFLDRHADLEKQAAVAGRVDGLSLDAMRALLHVLADPHLAAPVIHLTGTNGKGSVGRMVAALVAASGLKVGLYSSPHLQRVEERLWCSDAGTIDDETFAAVLTDLAERVPLAGVSPSWFELLTAAAFSWFAASAVDVAVVEVGMLGRFDATNVADGTVAVVTNVGADHTDFAPGWREAVAAEKAGIVKPDSFLVLGETDAELRPIFETAATGDDGEPRLWVRDDDFACELNRVAVGGRLVDVRTPGNHLPEVFLPVHGAHQGENAAIAVAAVEAFFAQPLQPAVVDAAFGPLRLPGRIEVVGRRPLTIVDAAHNAESAVALAETLDDDFAVEGRRLLVVGTLAGRDPDALLDALDVTRADLVVACAPDSPRAVPADDLAARVAVRGVPVVTEPTVAGAVERALAAADEEDLVVIAGSTYTAGAARHALGCDAV